MKLPDILQAVSALCLILGSGGMAGAIEWGTGYFASGALLLTAAVAGLWAWKEEGPRERRK